MPDPQPPPPGPSLHDRVERLEAQVGALREEIAALRKTRPAEAPRQERGRRLATTPPPKPPTKKKRSWSASLDLDSENWLSTVGIGLLLVGVAFFFKFSIDRGWLTPVVQVVLGLGFGAALGGLGLWVRGRRARLGQILVGGGSATLYATVFAAYQLYGLIAAPLAFAGMAVVTALTFALAVRTDDAALAVVGVLGAFGTPFVLFTGAGSVPGLVGYVALVIAGTSAIYLQKGWRSLLYAGVVGGWLTLAFAFLNLPGEDLAQIETALEAAPPATWSRQALQLGVLFAWLAFWSVPVLRAVRHAGDAGEPHEKPSSLIGAFLFRPPAHTLAFSSPLIALAFSRQLWDLPSALWGTAALAGCAVYVGAYVWLRRREALGSLAQAHALVASVLLAYGMSELLGGATFVLALAAEAAALHVLARRMGDRSLRLTGHVFFAVVAVALAGRLVFVAAGRPVLLSAAALTELGAILLMAGVTAVFVQDRAKRGYRIAAHALLLGWLLRECTALPGGQAYASIAWGLYAAALLVAGLALGRPLLRRLALATVLLLVGKLFLIDLARISALWRVLLFMGLGAAFLLLSYLLPGWFGTGGAGAQERGEEAADHTGS